MAVNVPVKNAERIQMDNLTTQQIIQKFLNLGVTLWAIHRELDVAYNTVRWWNKGEFEANEENRDKLEKFLKKVEEAETEK